MSAIKITNPRLSEALVEELENEPEYANVKAYAATHTFLSRVVRGQESGFAHLPAKRIKEWFDVHDIKYRPCLNILERHGLISVDNQYIVKVKPRGYRLTEKGVRLMYAGQLQYLKAVFNDRKLKRQIQNKHSYHRTKLTKLTHPLLQYIQAGLMRYEFDPAVIEMIEKSGWNRLAKLKALMNLTDFIDRDFVKLKFNDADNRVWNEFAGMKSELRKYFSLGDLKYRFVMDIRSCHPLFLGHYLVNRSEPRKVPANPIMVWEGEKVRLKRERSERLTNTNNTTIPSTSTPPPTLTNPPTSLSNNNPNPDYVGGNSDIGSELVSWNALFSDPDTDPKTVLINEIGYTREQAKAALNQSINGGKQYGRFIKWFKTKFPQLHSVWDQTYKNKVGVDISTLYETKLMQDMGLYELAKSLGLHLTYEFDGCGVMCREDDPEVLAKINQLSRHIQEHGERLWGIRPVLVVKTAEGEAVNPHNPATNRKSGAAEVKPGPPPSAPSTPSAVSESRRSKCHAGPPTRKRRQLPKK
jgi:hypothetical protein